MESVLKSLRVLADEGRLRLLRLLAQEELSVAELQEILAMGQSRISMQLSQLKQAGLVELRRAGQKSLYKLSVQGSEPFLQDILSRSGAEIAEARLDDEGLRLVLERRKDQTRDYFNELAGKFGQHYVPGRSWQALAEMLLGLLPPLVIADLGAGEGTLSVMLAKRATKMIAVDSSQKMMEHARGVAERSGLTNIDCRAGDLEDLPLSAAEVDIALMHQSLHHALHPAQAVKEAHRILKPGGRLVVIDLLKHHFEQARELYADVWLGFTKADLADLLRRHGFEVTALDVVHREEESPHFETVLAMGTKAA